MEEQNCEICGREISRTAQTMANHFGSPKLALKPVRTHRSTCGRLGCQAELKKRREKIRKDKKRAKKATLQAAA